MERVRLEMEKTKKEYDNILDEERKSMNKEMDRVRRDLEKEKKQVTHLTKAKRMSKGDMQEELVAMKTENDVSITVAECILLPLCTSAS